MELLQSEHSLLKGVKCAAFLHVCAAEMVCFTTQKETECTHDLKSLFKAVLNIFSLHSSVKFHFKAQYYHYFSLS